MLFKNNPTAKNERRIRAGARLEQQLACGTKTQKRTHAFHNREQPLSATDQARIHAEANALALRIAAPSIARSTQTKKTPASRWSDARRNRNRGKITR